MDKIKLQEFLDLVLETMEWWEYRGDQQEGDELFLKMECKLPEVRDIIYCGVNFSQGDRDGL